MKKLIGIIITIFLVLANIAYLKINTNDYTVGRLIILNLGIIGTNFIFWISLYSNLKKKNFIIFFFLLFLFLVDLDRMNVQIFLDYNDKIINSFLFSTAIGGVRLIFLFISIYFFFFLSSLKKFLLRIIGILNIVISVLIFIEFEGSFTPVIRIVIGVFYILYLLFFLKKAEKESENTIQEENKEDKHELQENSNIT